MHPDTQKKLYRKARHTVRTVCALPVVRVDREAFLRRTFAESPHLELILQRGPQTVYAPEDLRRRADTLIRGSAGRSSMASFATGLPGNPLVMVAAGGADVVQYFGFAIRLAEQIAYLFGDVDLYDADGRLCEAGEVRVLSWLGAMFGAAGATALVAQTSELAAATRAGSSAPEAVTATPWYPFAKKVGVLVGKQVAKKTLEKTVTKSVPLVGGVVSGGLTYASFSPMGRRLADAFVTIANAQVAVAVPDAG